MAVIVADRDRRLPCLPAKTDRKRPRLVSWRPAERGARRGRRDRYGPGVVHQDHRLGDWRRRRMFRPSSWTACAGLTPGTPLSAHGCETSPRSSITPRSARRAHPYQLTGVRGSAGASWFGDHTTAGQTDAATLGVMRRLSQPTAAPAGRVVALVPLRGGPSPTIRRTGRQGRSAALPYRLSAIVTAGAAARNCWPWPVAAPLPAVRHPGVWRPRPSGTTLAR